LFSLGAVRCSLVAVWCPRGHVFGHVRMLKGTVKAPFVGPTAGWSRGTADALTAGIWQPSGPRRPPSTDRKGGAARPRTMDVFALRQRLVDDYGSYIQSFLDVLAAGLLWPDPLIQLNPSFEPGPSIDELVVSAQQIVRRDHAADRRTSH